MAGGRSRQQVGRGRGDDHLVGPSGQLDMTHTGFGGFVQKLGMDTVATDRLQCQPKNR